jgi:hypothetical protein
VRMPQGVPQRRGVREGEERGSLGLGFRLGNRVLGFERRWKRKKPSRGERGREVSMKQVIGVVRIRTAYMRIGMSVSYAYSLKYNCFWGNI